MRFVAVALITLAGCAHKPQLRSEVVPKTTAAPPQAAVASTPANNSCLRDLDCAEGQLCLDGRCVPIADNLGLCTQAHVHFALNETLLADTEKPGLERAARCLKADHALTLAIEGNADERGTEEYNLALADKRARSVADYLRMLGASEAQLKTISYGKENPICTDHDEACWAQNRRADLEPPARASGKKRGHK